MRDKIIAAAIAAACTQCNPLAWRSFYSSRLDKSECRVNEEMSCFKTSAQNGMTGEAGWFFLSLCLAMIDSLDFAWLGVDFISFGIVLFFGMPMFHMVLVE